MGCRSCVARLSESHPSEVLGPGHMAMPGDCGRRKGHPKPRLWKIGCSFASFALQKTLPFLFIDIRIIIDISIYKYY